MLRVVTLAVATLGAAGLAFALWQFLAVADSLAGLWLVIWALAFGPAFALIAIAQIWSRRRRRTLRPRL